MKVRSSSGKPVARRRAQTTARSSSLAFQGSLRGRLERSRQSSAPRLRHLRTVSVLTPKRAASSPVGSPERAISARTAGVVRALGWIESIRPLLPPGALARGRRSARRTPRSPNAPDPNNVPQPDTYGRRTRGGGGGTLERGGAGGAVPRRGGHPLGPTRPSDLAAGEGSRGGRGGLDDRVRGAVGREAAGAVQRRGSGRARRPATAQRDETDDPEAGAARQAAGPPGGAAGGRRAVDQSQGRGVDGGGAGARLGSGPARLGGAAGGRVVGPGAAAGASGAGHGGRAGGV